MPRNTAVCIQTESPEDGVCMADIPWGFIDWQVLCGYTGVPRAQRGQTCMQLGVVECHTEHVLVGRTAAELCTEPMLSPEQIPETRRGNSPSFYPLLSSDLVLLRSV